MARGNDMTGWLILRCAGRHTMSLAASLAKDGFEVWTPIETVKIRVPRMNARREVTRPIMPSYLFARANRLVDLIQLADSGAGALTRKAKARQRRDVKIGDVEHFSAAEIKSILAARSHASFSVMHGTDGIPLIEDRHLDRLRYLEAKRTPIKRAAYSFPKGASARVDGGIAQGLVGIVVRSNPKSTVLHFTGRLPFEIPTSLLSLDGVKDDQAAALKAA